MMPLAPNNRPDLPSNPLWKIGSLPIDATAAIDLQSDPMRASQLLGSIPPQLQTISFGLVAETHTQGFIFEEDQSQFHESFWELSLVVMRLYLMIFFIDARQVENMVALIHENTSEGGPPISSITLALKPNVMFDNSEISMAIRQTNPKAIIWMSKSVSEAGHPVVSYKVLTPCLIGNVDVEFTSDGIDMKTAVDPRYPHLDPFDYLELVPLLNVEDYMDSDDSDADDDAGDDAGEVSENKEKETTAIEADLTSSATKSEKKLEKTEEPAKTA